MSDNRHLVFGAGLIGGYIAGGLSLAGLNCTMVARPSVRDALSKGLILSDYLGNEACVETPSFADAEQNIQYDYLWLTVKCTAIESALEEMAPFIGNDTTVICCQNGLGSDQAIRRRFSDIRVVQAVFGSNVAQPAPDRLHRSTQGVMVVEEDGQGDIEAMADVMNSELMPTRASRDFGSEQWAKLQLNLANAVNALADIPVKKMLENRELRRLIAALMREMLAVTDKKKVNLPRLSPLPPHWLPRLINTPDWLFQRLAQKMLAIDPTARASMWWDLKNGKTTEVNYLNAAVVREAEKLGLKAPVNQRVVELIRQVESGTQDRNWKPAELAGLLLNGRA
ncbi:2-dehydropantoate 2-reductase [Congregibacter sp.]|uniref:2-dehydropantoate 2-reductase n=1 Tax=Congregibacter sp. TaxID=2744308 RepID=UPI0038598025